MKWTPRATLIAGLALMALTNAVALGGAAYNRSGQPDSQLALTQREVQAPSPYSSRRHRDENSGLALTLQWRCLNDGETAYLGNRYCLSPPWLDAAKMAALGFDGRKLAPADGSEASLWRSVNQLPREVLVVLELNGPAYKEALRRSEKAYADAVGSNKDESDQRSAKGELEYERDHSSRLFAVDAGLDLHALRTQYPDRSAYAIVHARVQPIWSERKAKARGRIDDVHAEHINVPIEWRRALDGAKNRPANDDDKTPPFDALVAFGQRLEPWLVSAARR